MPNKSIHSLVRKRRGVRDLIVVYETMLRAIVPTRPTPRPWVRPQVRVEPGPLRNKQQAYQALRCQIYELLVRECELTLCIHGTIARRAGVKYTRHQGVLRAKRKLDSSRYALKAYKNLCRSRPSTDRAVDNQKGVTS